MKILLAVDGSPFTTRAVKYVTTHFDLFGAGAELQLLTVTPPVPAGLATANARKILGDAALEKYYGEEAAAGLKQAEKMLLKAAIPFHSVHKVGAVAEQIVGFAKKNKTDLIVMGSHGHGALANVLMGSITTKVLASTSTPVLVVR
jgi:nucleotide-binding universal stress UspA family protein